MCPKRPARRMGGSPGVSLWDSSVFDIKPQNPCISQPLPLEDPIAQSPHLKLGGLANMAPSSSSDVWFRWDFFNCRARFAHLTNARNCRHWIYDVRQVREEFVLAAWCNLVGWLRFDFCKRSPIFDYMTSCRIWKGGLNRLHRSIRHVECTTLCEDHCEPSYPLNLAHVFVEFLHPHVLLNFRDDLCKGCSATVSVTRLYGRRSPETLTNWQRNPMRTS